VGSKIPQIFFDYTPFFFKSGLLIQYNSRMKAVEVGDGTTTDRDTPTLVSGGYKFTSISVGTSHTCGLLLSGEAICWGDNYHGQPGDGVDPSTRGFQDVYYPLTVAGGISSQRYIPDGDTRAALNPTARPTAGETTATANLASPITSHRR